MDDFVQTMEELEEFAQAKRGLGFLGGSSKSVKPGDMEEIFDFNERLTSPDYERYRSFRRLSVLDEVSIVSE